MKSRHRAWVTLATLLIVVLGATLPAAAANIFVTTTAQKISATGGCSLQEAILSANFDSNMVFNDTTFFSTGCAAGNGDDTIILPAGQVFLMNQIVDEAQNPFGPTATPMITSNIRLEANGSRLEWVGPQRARAFAVASTGNLTLRNAYIKNFLVKGGDGADGGGGGLGAGGAIYLKGGGVLTVDRSTFEGNGAIGGNGSAVSGFAGGGGGGLSGNGGPKGLFTSGSGGGGGGGGSRGNGAAGATCAIETCRGAGGGGGGTVTDGQPPTGFFGLVETGGLGGFACGGKGGNGGGNILGGSADGANGCAGGGGGGGGSSEAGILGDAGEGGAGGYGGGGGGGGHSDGSGGNGGFGGGGGGGTASGSVTGNSGGRGGFGAGGGASTRTAGAGGPGQSGLFAGAAGETDSGAGAALGGAIFNDGGTLVVLNSTFTANFVAHGTSGPGAGPASDAGAAIFSLGGSTSVFNSTLSGNESTGSGGGIVVFSFGVPPPAASFELRNTIVANNGANECAIGGLSSVSGSGNLIEQNGGGSEACPGVVSTSDPQLGPLQINSPGLTPTMAIPTTSPAFDTADGGTSLATDQRGVARPQGLGFDIGAYERCFGNEVLQPCERAVFEPPVLVTLTTLASPAAGGTVSPPSGNFVLNSVVQLSATPNPGFFFISWTGNVGDPLSASTFVVMDQSQTVTANFGACVSNLYGRGTPGSSVAPPRVDLTWTPIAADHYNVLRSTTSGGPYAKVGMATTNVFSDRTPGLVNNTKYFYVLQAANAADAEMCRSNEVGVTIPKGR